MVFPFQPMPLGRRAAPFDHPEWVFEVKHDGFRAIAYVKAGHCELVSYVDHLEERGEELFQLACREDLEGIVAKWKNGLYDAERVRSWVKIKNPGYSQILGRQELFDRRNRDRKSTRLNSSH